MGGDARRTERFPCVVFATVVKPISDLRLLISGLCAILFALSLSAEAQQATKKIPRVGFLSLNTAFVQKDRVEVFREALRKLGYVEGQNIIIDYRFADGKSERLPGLVAELVALKVDVMVTAGNSATAPAKDATKTIPIVMMNDSDPVGQGHIDSLARPGGNITGLSSTDFDLADKRLELLKEIVSKTLTRGGPARSDEPSGGISWTRD